jgi:hypothetical protein
MANQASTTERILKLQSCRPFRSFWLVSSTGEQLPVHEPQHVMVTGDSVIVADGRSPIRAVTVGEIAGIEEDLRLSDRELAVREQLKRHLSHRPFAPFAIVFAGGSRFEVTRILQAAVGQSRGMVVSSDGKHRREFHVGDIQAFEQMAAV